jgi:hypothetical protein
MAVNPFARPADGGHQAAETKGFDRVRMVVNGGGEKVLSRAEYDRLPLQTRIKSFLEGNSKFFLGEREVSPREALKAR